MSINNVVRIQRRRGTAAQWASANPVLLAGEEGFESDTGKVKIGDGAAAWASLKYRWPFDPSNVAITVAASRDLAASDLNANLVCNSGGAVALNLTTALPAGFACAVTQYGVGKVTITAGAGVTIRSAGGLVSTSGQYATIGIMPLGANEYVLSGSLGS